MAFRQLAGLKNPSESAMNRRYFRAYEEETNLTILRLTVISKIIMERGRTNFLKPEFFNR
jgi:hypothetical protein